MIVGFTGTRDGMTWVQQGALDEYLQLEGATFHHGDCLGADEQADAIAWRYGLQRHIHPPVDPKLRAYCHRIRELDNGDRLYSEKPYLDRNRDIVDACDVLVAAPKERPFGLDAVPGQWPKGGTWHTVRYAQRTRKPIVIVWANGSVERLP